VLSLLKHCHCRRRYELAAIMVVIVIIFRVCQQWIIIFSPLFATAYKNLHF
jgi:hypothetical protein